MLIVKVFGGLGNQMFQYAFYEYLKRNNDNVYLDTFDFIVHRHHTGYELKRLFDIDDKEADLKMVKKVAINANSFFIRAICKTCHVEIRRFEECKGHHHFIIIDDSRISENVYFDGYWQNVRYLEPIRNELRSIFQFKNPLRDQNQKLSHYIEKNECVALHVRRGDYLSNKKLSQVCGKEYYNEAVNYFMDTCGSKIIFIVFSDDVKWAIRNLLLPKDTIYVDWNKGSHSYIDMQLMGLCQHSIIANSTFSWWPAWLKADEKHRVVMPKNWFINENSMRLEIPGSIKV